MASSALTGRQFAGRLSFQGSEATGSKLGRDLVAGHPVRLHKFLAKSNDNQKHYTNKRASICWQFNLRKQI